MWQRVHIAVVHMPFGTEENKYIVVALEDMSGWPKARALGKATTQAMADFLRKEIFARHGCPTTIFMDGRSENKGVVDDVCNLYSIKKYTVTAYHLQPHGILERGYK